MSTSPAPCYLYGFIRQPYPPVPALVGVAEAEIEVIDGDGVAAVVSPLPSADPRASRSDLLAHSDVLRALVAEQDVVPAHFGSIYPRGLQLDELPTAQMHALHRLFDGLSGRIEMQVKGAYAPGAITRAIVERDNRLRRLRAGTEDYSIQLALGSRFADQLERQRRADTNGMVRRLSKTVVDITIDAIADEWAAFKLACLVDRKQLDRFERFLLEAAGDLAPEISLTWLGPLPPYSFVPSSHARSG